MKKMNMPCPNLKKTGEKLVARFLLLVLFIIPVLCIFNSSNLLHASETLQADSSGCLDLQGYWLGHVDLNEYGAQAINATIYQSGCYIVISTSSILSYGKNFSGEILQGDYLTVLDTSTWQTWTTHFARANLNSIRLYDYVHNFTDFDELILDREPLPK